MSTVTLTLTRPQAEALLGPAVEALSDPNRWDAARGGAGMLAANTLERATDKLLRALTATIGG
jgi:hypothetical protein